MYCISIDRIINQLLPSHHLPCELPKKSRLSTTPHSLRALCNYTLVEHTIFRRSDQTENTRQKPQNDLILSTLKPPKILISHGSPPSTGADYPPRSRARACFTNISPDSLSLLKTHRVHTGRGGHIERYATFLWSHGINSAHYSAAGRRYLKTTTRARTACELETIITRIPAKIMDWLVQW